MAVEVEHWMTERQLADIFAIAQIAASAYVVASVAVHNFTAVSVIVVTALMTYMTRLNPLCIFAAAALLGSAGWL